MNILLRLSMEECPADSNKACASVAAITSVVNLVVASHRQEKCVCVPPITHTRKA